MHMEIVRTICRINIREIICRLTDLISQIFYQYSEIREKKFVTSKKMKDLLISMPKESYIILWTECRAETVKYYTVLL